MRNRQRGITFIGWVFLLIPVAIVGYAAIRLTPVVMNYVKVSRILQQVADEMKADDSLNVTTIRNSLDKRFDIDYIEFPKSTDIVVRREGDGWIMQARYDDVAPLFANASILLEFDKTVTIQ